MNKIFLTGNVGHTPELKDAKNGKPFLRFSVAENYKDFANGQREPKSQWYSVTIFGGRAESLSKFLAKGEKVAVTGTMRVREFDGKQGEKRFSLDIVADDIELLSGRDGASKDAEPKKSAGTHREESASFPDDDDELPF